MIPVPVLARLEGGAIAASAVVLFVTLGFAWWWLLAVFVLFDVAFVGYAGGFRLGAITYNAVHNYVAPAVLISLYAILVLVGVSAWSLAFIAGCWLFHVGADRAMGFGPRPSA